MSSGEKEFSFHSKTAHVYNKKSPFDPDHDEALSEGVLINI